MFSIIKHYRIWFVFSGGLVLISLGLLLVWGLRPGLEFRGGTLTELQFQNPVDAAQIRSELMGLKGVRDAVVQPVSKNIIIVKTPVLEQTELLDLRQTLSAKFGEAKENRFESIGPTISRELVRNAYWQIGLVALGILLYTAYAFRKITKNARQGQISSWRFGTAAILALLHDLVITVGAFVILGRYRGVEIDSLFITALLTIMGFSVHDTIVVFDRIRENLQKYPYKSLLTIMDHSINSTLARSINTSSTLIFVLVGMLLFGGQTVFNFVLALLVGVSVGTYSSIFVASPLLYVWAKAGD